MIRIAWTLAIAFTSIVAGNAHALPIIFNGSLTGRVSQSQVPPFWTINGNIGSPDTNDVSSNVGGSQPFATPPQPSPDGGTWVGMARTSAFFSESFGQDVQGFHFLHTYTVSYYHANFGAGLSIDGNAIELLVNGVSFLGGPSLRLGPDWLLESVSFVAPTTGTLRLDFQLAGISDGYHSIDGITIKDTGTSIPEPTTLTVFGLTALCGLLYGWRRRRQASA